MMIMWAHFPTGATAPWLALLCGLLGTINCHSMESETSQDLKVEASLIRRTLVEGESVEVRLKYTNATSRPRPLTVPDLQVPSTIDFEIAIRRRNERIAEISADTLPETVESVHAEPEERVVFPGDSTVVILTLSPYLPSLESGTYTLEVDFPLRSGESSLTQTFKVRPLSRIRAGETVQDGRLVGLTSAYVASSNTREDVVLIEQLDDFTRTSFDAVEWPVQYRRRVVEHHRQEKDIAQVLIARRSHTEHPWRHLLVKTEGGTWEVITLHEGRPADRHELRDVQGRPLSRSLVSFAEGTLVFVTADKDHIRRYRYTRGEHAQVTGSAEGEVGRTRYLYVDTHRRWLLYTDAEERCLQGIDLTASELRIRSLWRAHSSIQSVETTTVLTENKSALLLALLHSVRGAEASVNVLRWPFSGRPTVIDPTESKAAVASIRFAVSSNGVCHVVKFEEGMWRTRPVEGGGEFCYAVESMSGELVFTRGSSWVTLAHGPH